MTKRSAIPQDVEKAAHLIQWMGRNQRDIFRSSHEFDMPEENRSTFLSLATNPDFELTLAGEPIETWDELVELFKQLGWNATDKATQWSATQKWERKWLCEYLIRNLKLTEYSWTRTYINIPSDKHAMLQNRLEAAITTMGVMLEPTDYPIVSDIPIKGNLKALVQIIIVSHFQLARNDGGMLIFRRDESYL